MLIQKPTDIKPSEITPKELYLNRRQFMTTAGALALTGSLSSDLLLPAEAKAGKKLSFQKNAAFSTDDKLSDYDDAASYNNFYEFTTDKDKVAAKSKKFTTRPWTITVEGHVKEKRIFSIDELLQRFTLEERVYRFRCVEAFSFVIPWIGFPLSDLISLCEPTSRAGYVEFTTLHDPKRMPGQNRGYLEWPYVEGLRLDEAMHPLTLMVVGMYGEILPNQNGAPLRLMVPWKYGFKSIKSIVRIRFVEEMVRTSWMRANAEEYGFYANINPQVDHPRWSQARERRIGEFKKRETLMFNGYGDQVAGLYQGMDLRKYF